MHVCMLKQQLKNQMLQTLKAFYKKIFSPATMAAEISTASGRSSCPWNVVNPDAAWNALKSKVVVKECKDVAIDPFALPPKASDDLVRFVCMSDTHGRTDQLKVPDGDVFIHAGDFTMLGFAEEVEKFSNFLGTLPHAHKIVIAGNHDLTFDLEAYENIWNHFHGKKGKQNPLEAKQKLLNCTYLEDEMVQVHGFNIYGSPWQPWFGDWGFNAERDAIHKIWNKIPTDTDILITHGPPVGHGDMCFPHNNRAGCVELLWQIENRIKPKLHVFGHIHEGFGVTTNGETIFANASTCTLKYKADNPALIFDLPKPQK